MRLGVGGAAVAWRWRLPLGGPPARPPARRLPAAGPGPVPRRSVVGPPLRALRPLGGRLFTCVPSPGTSPPSVVRPALSRSRSLFRALPPRAPPARARHPLPVGAPLTPSVATRGAPGTRARAGLGPRGPAVWGSGAERAASGRERGEGLRPVSGTRVGASSGGGRGVSCGGRPGPPAGVPRHGPVAPRPRVLRAAAGGEACRSVSGRR